ncbi:MAG: hypothetical protein K2G68_06445 [Helicobacter sp.]|nr:hypothetical protein [Helicobacter sp.]
MKKCCPGLPIAFIVVFAIGAFLYYQYAFTSVSKINFNEDSFYQYQENTMSLFEPKSSQYKLCFYTSFTPQSTEFLRKNIQENLILLALDLYQQGENAKKDVHNLIELRISSALMLKLIHEFDVRTLPQCFLLNQESKNSKLYISLKESGIYKLVNFKENKNKE